MKEKGKQKSLPQSGRDMQEVIQSEKLGAVARLSETISHKINNHLTYVLNYLFILKSSFTDQKLHSLVLKVEEGLNRTRDILHNLVDSSKYSWETHEDIELEKELKIIIDKFLHVAREKGISLEAAFKGSNAIRANRRGLNIVMANVLQNAFESGAGVIKITSFRKKGTVSITVSDNGCGINREHLELVFEPFFTTKTEHKGLGLYSSYNLVRSFGGSITCSSIPGKETLIVMAIPVTR